jgi:hypothetical protein
MALLRGIVESVDTLHPDGHSPKPQPQLGQLEILALVSFSLMPVWLVAR